MPDRVKKKLTITTAIFWILFVYIIAALLWWFFSLIQQDKQMLRLKEQNIMHTTTPGTAAQMGELANIREQSRRNEVKFVGEGSIFLLLIIVGAIYIFRSVRRQLSLQQQQQNFVMAVTHELKTPISVARLNLETLKRYQLDAEKQKKLIDISLQETMRLDMLINNILISSQLDGKAYEPSKEEIDFSDLVNDVAQQFGNRYPDRNLIIDIDENIDITGDGLLLKLLISNLLENANKYSEKGKPIELELHQQNEEVVVLQVKDQGPGIAAEEKSQIFKKFYRIGNEQTRTTKGTGLGLYICKKIAEAHNATIQVTDNTPQGSNFIVHFIV